MPEIPYPISVTVYDTDNSTVKSGVSVLVRNVTNGESLTIQTTNSQGKATFDLADLDTDTAEDDVVMIVAYDSSGNSDGERHVVDLTVGSYNSTLYLNPCEYSSEANLRLTWLGTANDNASAYYCKVYRVLDGREMDMVQTLANDSRERNYSSDGLNVNGGYVVVRENKLLIVHTKTKATKPGYL